MIEIHLCKKSDQIKVIRTLGENTRVQISAEMSADEILGKLSIELKPDEYQAFLNLWSNDSYPREFNQHGNILVIKDKD